MGAVYNMWDSREADIDVKEAFLSLCEIILHVNAAKVTTQLGFLVLMCMVILLANLVVETSRF